MMPSRGMFYGVVVFLVAMLIVTSSLAAIYFQELQAADAQNNEYVSELNVGLASYRVLSGAFNSTLDEYNATLSLLTGAVANLNTSTPAYINASRALSSLWASYRTLAETQGRRVPVYSADVLLDYGNGTRVWYNGTAFQPGWSAYVLTLALMKGNLQATWYPQYGEHFVGGVNGVPGTDSSSWFVWELNSGKWTVSSTGADYIHVQNGTVIAWTLCGYDASFNPECSP